MLPHFIIHSLLHYLSTGRLREVENKGKFKTIKMVAVAYEMAPSLNVNTL